MLYNSFMVDRKINLKNILSKKSLFLLGPRGTGKSFWIKKSLPNTLSFDLLNRDTFERFLKRPHQLSEEIPSHVKDVVIDEIQKIPELLDEVHRLIETRGIRFLLTGSSPRKLKQKGVNLLAGRARDFRFFPLTLEEISEKLSDQMMLKLMNKGGVPSLFFSDEFDLDIRSYIQFYIMEEIKAEAIVRRVDNFARFIDVLGLQNAKEMHFQNIASDSGVPVRTVENYLGVVEDTLLGFCLAPFERTQKRKAITRSKFYFFDLGVARYLSRQGEIKMGSVIFGEYFEHFIILEIRAHFGLRGREALLQYWRSKNGFEVDLILNNKIALEFKATKSIDERHLKGLVALREENLLEEYMVVSLDPIDRTINNIQVIHWRTFLQKILPSF